nr:S8 family serine peptidase [Xanthomonadales bacterium]
MKSRYTLTRLAIAAAIALAGCSATPGPDTTAGVNDPTASYIVKGNDLDVLATHIDRIGGTVTAELGIIDSLGVILTDEQRQLLAQSPAVDSIFADRPTRLQGATADKAGACTESVMADHFDQNSFYNNHGNVNWSEHWREKGESNGTGWGRVRVSNGKLRFVGSLYSSTAVERRLDVEAGRYAYLTFDVSTNSSVASSDELEVYVATRRYEDDDDDSDSEDDDDYITVKHHLGYVELGPDTRVSRSFNLEAFEAERYVAVGFKPTNSSGSSQYEVSLDNVKVSQTSENPGAYASEASEADLLHAAGIDGSGVTIAFVDSGIDTQSSALTKDDGTSRLLGAYAVVGSPDDFSGHGTHLVSVATQAAASPSICSTGGKLGIAPGADVVSIKAFDDQGNGSYLNVVQALDMILDLKDTHNIRVVNLSFGSTAQTAYWEDPVNQAVMRLWAEGLVVVTSAGNDGPDAMSITVPGNVPYVITTGAMTNGYTKNQSDDRVASFSGAGPTQEGFLKPDLVAPGGHLLGAVGQGKQMAVDLASYRDQVNSDFLLASGTSQASAVVAGAAALLLDFDPLLSNDDVKCRLMGGAKPAILPNGELAYSPFRQGAGLLSLDGAINASLTDCANDGLDIFAELDTGAHHTGPVTADTNEQFQVVQNDGSVWNEGSAWNEGSTWNESSVWNEGSVWNEHSIWNESSSFVESILGMLASFWNEGSVWNEGSAWNESSVWNEGSMWNEGSAW